MNTTISHRKLKTRTGEVLRRAEAGEELTITMDGRSVAQLGPVPRRRWVKKAEYLQILRAGTHDPRFFDDLAELSGEQTRALMGRRISRNTRDSVAGESTHDLE